jgi:hypothetical protein
MKIYLACPYSHPNPEVREERFEIANRVAAELMRQGHVVFSPISHSHPVAKYLPLELLMDHEFWMKQDLPMLLEWADALYVYPYDAAAVSRGVAREVKEAEAAGIPIEYLKPWHGAYPGVSREEKAEMGII